MGENPPVSDGKQLPSSLLGNANSLSEHFDARVKHFRYMTPLPFLARRASDAILKVAVERKLQWIAGSKWPYYISSEGKSRKKEVTKNSEKEMNIYKKKEVRRRNKEKKTQNEKNQ